MVLATDGRRSIAIFNYAENGFNGHLVHIQDCMPLLDIMLGMESDHSLLMAPLLKILVILMKTREILVYLDSGSFDLIENNLILLVKVLQNVSRIYTIK